MQSEVLTYRNGDPIVVLQNGSEAIYMRRSEKIFSEAMEQDIYFSRCDGTGYFSDTM
jgi:hypothetical protein